MKCIITESQIKNLIKKYFEKDFSNKIKMVQIWDDLPFSFKRMIGERKIWNHYLNLYGPMYVILVGNNEYLAQARENNNWIIVDEDDIVITELEMMDLLGITPLGLSLGDFLDAYIEE